MNIADSSLSINKADNGNHLFRDELMTTIDELEKISHLVAAATLACSSIEDLRDRNAFVALLSQIEGNIGALIDKMRDTDVSD